MGLAVAATTDEARAYNRVQVKGWVTLLTDFSNRRLTTVWARAGNMSREGLMVKSWRPLSKGSIVYVRSQQLHFLAGWARVRHCRRSGWMYRIGLEFRKPLFTAMYDWREDGAEVAAPQNLHHRWRLNVLDFCFGQAEVPTNFPQSGLADDPGPVKTANAAVMAQPEPLEATGGSHASDVAAVVEAEERDHTDGSNRTGVVCVAVRDGGDAGKADEMAGDTGPAEPSDVGAHSACARTAKQLRANTVARLIKELSVLKHQRCGEGEYARLSGSHPDFLTFRIADLRPDLKQKVVEIRSSSKHIRLAQELAAAHHSKSVATIQDDWKRYKPVEFKLGRSRR